MHHSVQVSSWLQQEYVDSTARLRTRRKAVSTAAMALSSFASTVAVSYDTRERAVSDSSSGSEESVEMIENFTDSLEASPCARSQPAGRRRSVRRSITIMSTDSANNPVTQMITTSLVQQASDTIERAKNHHCAEASVCCDVARQLSGSDEAALARMLRRCHSWDFDVFLLAEMVQDATLPLLCDLLLNLNHVTVALKLTTAEVWRLTSLLQVRYRSENSYHNSLHAADVTQTVSVFLQEKFFMSHISPLDYLCSIIAAAAHDVGHPGTPAAAFVCGYRSSER